MVRTATDYGSTVISLGLVNANPGLISDYFSLEFHKLISRLYLKVRWASKDAMKRLLTRFAYAITSNTTFLTISNSSVLIVDN